MTETKGTFTKGRALMRWLFAAAFVLALALSGLFSGLMNEAGLLYLVFGSVAAALMGFTVPEIAMALRQAAGRPGTRESRRRAAHFWEAAARNAWLLGALGSALNFTIALGSDSGGISGISGRMIQSLVVMLYGLVLAVVCLIPAMKLAEAEIPAGPAAEGTSAAALAGRPAGPVAAGRVFGYVLFVTTVAATVLFLTGAATRRGPLPLGKVLLHGPAILVVFGGAIALALFAGAGVGARALTLGFAVTGIIALLSGLIQALLGFVHVSVTEISAAVAFIITASSFSLLGLVAVAGPLEDREIMDGRRDRPSPLSRLLWAVFPVLVFICLVLTFVMVVTPMTKPGG